MFGTELRTEITIDAPAERVWAVLTNFDEYPEWNPFIRSISGDLRVGSRLAVTVSSVNGKTFHFKPNLLTVAPNRELRWLGRFIVPGLFDGEHFFLLGSQLDGRTRVEHGERFSGALIPFMGTLLAQTTAGFRQMNEALKKKSEE